MPVYWFFCSSVFGRGQLIESALQRYQILNEDNLFLFIRYVYNFEAFIFREIEAVIGFFVLLFFGRGQSIKSALQHYQILNEESLK